MKVLIVGLGSIAKKHLKALFEIDPTAEVFAWRHQAHAAELAGVENIYKKSEIPENLDFAIIANPTSEHHVTLEALLPLNIPFFIEKPLFSNLSAKQKLLALINKRRLITYVACNMRFHPAIVFLKQVMQQRHPIEMNVYCGSYLPDWRPDTDYRKNYSAIKALGGGVDLDLIHEVDYTLYLMGQPQQHSRYVAKKSALAIDTPDIAHYVLAYENTSVFITLNYYRKIPKRAIEIVWEDAIWQVDLLNSTIVDANDQVVFKKDFQMMDTYLIQLQYFMECLETHNPPMNNIEEAYQTLKVALDE